MTGEAIRKETFSIEFIGRSFAEHEISACALAQSLVALEALARQAAAAVYGQSVQPEVQVRAGVKPCTYVFDLIFPPSEKDAVPNITAVDAIIGVVELSKWACGKTVKVIDEGKAAERVSVGNAIDPVSTAERSDAEGADSIKISSDAAETTETITKEDRRFLSRKEGRVVTDSNSEMILEVVEPMLNGSPQGWRFSEGEGGIEFTAAVEDADFLEKVKQRRGTLVNGTCIRAAVKVVQRKAVKIVTERSITEVFEVIEPTG